MTTMPQIEILAETRDPSALLRMGAEIQPHIEHPLRRDLNDEVHARPPDSLSTPAAVSYVARVPARDLTDAPAAELLRDLLRRFGADEPDADIRHFTTALDELRLRWEHHTEYNRYTFVAVGVGGEPFAETPAARIPPDWLGKMQGEVLIGVHAWIAARDDCGASCEVLHRSASYPLFGVMGSSLRLTA